mgnify:CR=1 FL=1
MSELKGKILLQKLFNLSRSTRIGTHVVQDLRIAVLPIAANIMFILSEHS